MSCRLAYPLIISITRCAEKNPIAIAVDSSLIVLIIRIVVRQGHLPLPRNVSNAIKNITSGESLMRD